MSDTIAPNPESEEKAPGAIRQVVDRLVPKTRNGRVVAAIAIAMIVGVPGTLALIFPVDHPVTTYASVFVLSLLATSVGYVVIIVPPAMTAYIIFAGSQENVLVVGVLAGVGMALGDLSKYVAGGIGAAATGGKEIKLWPWLRRIVDTLVSITKRLLDRFGTLTLMAMAAIPFNQLVDVAYLSAGANGMPVRQFLGAAVVGRVIRCLLLASFGEVLSRAT